MLAEGDKQSKCIFLAKKWLSLNDLLLTKIFLLAVKREEIFVRHGLF